MDCFINAFKKKKNKKRSKELIPKMKQRRLRAITLQGAIEKNEWFDSTIIISPFGGTNNIFADIVCVFIYSGRPECSSYFVLNDSTRSIGYGNGKKYA
mgnify:CR=1 FL=1